MKAKQLVSVCAMTLALGVPLAFSSAAYAQGTGEDTPEAHMNRIKTKMADKEGMVTRESFLKSMGEHYDKMKKPKMTAKEAAMVIKDIGKSYGYAQ